MAVHLLGYGATIAQGAGNGPTAVSPVTDPTVTISTGTPVGVVLPSDMTLGAAYAQFRTSALPGSGPRRASSTFRRTSCRA